jgi:hypothetical protein
MMDRSRTWQYVTHCNAISGPRVAVSNKLSERRDNFYTAQGSSKVPEGAVSNKLSERRDRS